ncbi:hypothetical protein Bca52824_021805 [Brassica carinata]|uniref:Homeobox-leucine zipper protein n=1 Tax=Brassica carinata TaxID=52824 RepID=A0A8X7VEZ5_BRACI|nr:hypothetical protein Bca52824_021805 [Brassica carinata]
MIFLGTTLIVAGNSYTPALTQATPVICVPESENVTNEYSCPSNNDEMMKRKKKKLTKEQLASLEQSFQEDIKLDSNRKLKLSKELRLQPRQIAVWFQNRRARWKVKDLEESYDSLRQEYDVVSRENQMLYDEVYRICPIFKTMGFFLNYFLILSERPHSSQVNFNLMQVMKLRGIILKDHLVKMQSSLNNNHVEGGSQRYGTDQYNNPMFVASTCLPPISQQRYPW